jgi:uncharacterized protein involved in exopolysaccharide biosynthesis
LPKFLDVKQWLRVLWQNPLLFLATLLLGAATSFVYSYAPLHRAKDWKIEYLDERLVIRSKQVGELEEELRKARKSLEGTPSGEELGAVRAQLKEATSLASAREKEMEALSRKLRSTQKSRDEWKSRYDATSSQLEAAAAEPEGAAAKSAVAKSAAARNAAADSSRAKAPDPEPPIDAAESNPAAPAPPRDDD